MNKRIQSKGFKCRLKRYLLETISKRPNQSIQSQNLAQTAIICITLLDSQLSICQNIINMIEFDLEVQINDLLTIFLQNFKNIFAAKMSLIESICCHNNSLQSNPQYLLSRLSNKSFKFQWSLDPYSINITQQIISNIQRFYLRIQQYLEFRLSTLFNLEDKAFNKQMEIFYRNLNKMVSSLENHMSMAFSVGDFLSQFSKAEISFTSKLLELIQGKNHSLTRGPLDYESLVDIRALIESKICKQQLSVFREKKIVISLPPPPSREKRLSLKLKEDEGKLKILVRKKIPSKLQGPRQRSLPRSQIYPLEDNAEQNNWDSKVITPQDETVDLSSYVQKQNKLKLNKVYDILEVDPNCKILPKQQILSDLEGKNAKNKILIEKYLSKYQKKQRRVLRRQKSEKESKSTAKSSKVPSKNQEWSIFSAKLQSSQHQYLSRFRNNNENLKKYEQFELPLILSQKNRRTTVEK